MPERKFEEKRMSERKVLKRIGALSLAKIYTIIMAIVGLFLGIIYAAGAATLGPTAVSQAAAQDPLLGLGWFAIIVVPIVYAIMGFFMGLIGAWLYNLIAKWIGGVELEFEK